tara:strand:- start:21908 stop:22561 length:654 start_codon:yes stop_codon:yes gene_type:complete
MTNPIRIIVTDDHQLVRTGLAEMLQRLDGIEVVGQAENGEEALFLCQKLKPDLILMDVQMEGMGGISAVRSLKQHHPGVKTIALSTFSAPETVRAMLDAGACGYLLKNITTEELESAIRKVDQGETVIASDIEASAAKPDSVDSSEFADVVLGTQQQKVLMLLTKGFTNPEIAAHLGFSTTTARYHVSAILTKLGVSNRAEATAIAIRNGLIDETKL